MTALERLKRPLSPANRLWWGDLSPEVAMFGTLSANISQEAAAKLLAECFEAYTDEEEPESLSDLVSDVPAWATSSPWHNGYSLRAYIE